MQSQLQTLIDRIEKNKDSVTTEEATKTSFILPFLNILGYDIFDPTVVVPEFTADIGRKKGEKVDYAIMIDNKPLILIEAKPHTQKLDRHKTQLERYYTVTDAKFAILTNGIEYWFYSDIEKPNVMDQSPFLTINLLNLKSRDIKELEKFKYDSIDIQNILNMAGERKYINLIKDLFKQEVKDPSDDFVRLFASKLINKPLRQNIIEEFKSYTKRALSEALNDLVSEKIESISSKLNEDQSNQTEQEPQEEKVDKGIETTQEELEGYFIIKSILASQIDLSRIAQRDTKSYFGVLLDDNNRKWIARLHFNYSNKYIEIRTSDKESQKYQIQKPEDIYNYKKELLNTLTLFE